jgi:hydroxyacylglutathione hydrolase
MEPVLHVRAFDDNYIWLIRGRTPASHQQVLIVDPGEAEPVLAALSRQHLTPRAILCTHHHGDHVGGVADLVRQYPVPVYGPATGRIAGVDRPVREGDTIHIADMGIDLQVMELPGHTRDHLGYHGHGMLFCGDTLFSAGCGRLFEGSPQDMHASLSRLAALPPDTAVYCAHEYTLSNLRFAQTVEPDNPAVREHRQRADGLRARHEPTVPSTLELEQHINPFLRTAQAAVRAAAESHSGLTLPDPVSVFAALRRWKDNFK